MARKHGRRAGMRVSEGMCRQVPVRDPTEETQLLGRLLASYEGPDDGLFKQLKKALIERADISATRTAIRRIEAARNSRNGISSKRSDRGRLPYLATARQFHATRRQGQTRSTASKTSSAHGMTVRDIQGRLSNSIGRCFARFHQLGHRCRPR
jgi:hypothetical protein